MQSVIYLFSNGSEKSIERANRRRYGHFYTCRRAANITYYCPLFKYCMNPYQIPLYSVALPFYSETVNTLQKNFIDFDKTNPKHTASLYRLGKLMFDSPEKPFTRGEIYDSSRWTTVGFQSTDPSTDIRAGGFFAVDNMCYLLEHHPHIKKQISDYQYVDIEHYLPFALACINVSYALGRALYLVADADTMVTQDEALLYYNFAVLLEHDSHAFQKIFCAAMLYLLNLWTESHAKYMDFGSVLLRVKERVCDVCLDAPSDADAFVMAVLNDELDPDTITLI